MPRPRSIRLLLLRGASVPRPACAVGPRWKGDRHAGSCSRESGPPGHPRGGSREGFSNRLRRLRGEICGGRREHRLRGWPRLVLRAPGAVGPRRESGRHAGSCTREGCAFGGPRGTDLEDRPYRPFSPEATLVKITHG